MGIANASTALDAEARTLDGLPGGLGGCPFAPWATGNVVFEDLVYLCERKGFATGINLEKLVAVREIAAAFERHETAFRTQLALPILFDFPDIKVALAGQSLTIGKCDDELAPLLNLAVGDPVVEVRRVICDVDEYVLYLTDVTYRIDYVRRKMDLLE